jgi:hypothetical protein
MLKSQPGFEAGPRRRNIEHFFHSENRFGLTRTFGGGQNLVIYAGTPPKKFSGLAKYGSK